MELRPAACWCSDVVRGPAQHLPGKQGCVPWMLPAFFPLWWAPASCNHKRKFCSSVPLPSHTPAALGLRWDGGVGWRPLISLVLLAHPFPNPSHSRVLSAMSEHAMSTGCWHQGVQDASHGRASLPGGCFPVFNIPEGTRGAAVPTCRVPARSCSRRWSGCPAARKSSPLPWLV